MKNYKTIWNNLSTSFSDAGHFVGYLGDEDELRRNGQITADFLREALQIEANDKVLEIGCGIARIGRELASMCGEWHGTDISGNMIAYARQRTQDIPNIYLHELPTSDLSVFNDGYFDCVYSSIVFMHLDKFEMFNYICEAYRVLAPGGRAYFDTYNVLSPEAWDEFVKILRSYEPGHRPGHVSQFSTPQEMEKFLNEAGFTDVHVTGDNPQLVVGLGRKPEQEGFMRPTAALKSGARETETRTTIADSLLREMEGHSGSAKDEHLMIGNYIVRKDDYVNKLETTVAEKNRHIAQLEARLRKTERLMRPLPVRLAMRISKRFR